MASLSVKGGNVQERREEDANLKLEDLGLACPLESETQVPGWVQTLGKYLSVVGSLHDLLIQAAPEDVEIRQLEHASTSFLASKKLSAYKHNPYSFDSNPEVFSRHNAVTIVDFLSTCVQIENVLFVDRNEEEFSMRKPVGRSSDAKDVDEDFFVSSLRRTCARLKIPSKGFSSSELLERIQSKVDSVKRKLPKEYFDPTRRIVSKNGMTAEDMQLLKKIGAAMEEDHAVRRKMLIKRLDVTLQSFLWSDKVVGNEEEFLNAVDPLVSAIKKDPEPVDVMSVFDATPNLVEDTETRVTERSLPSSMKNVLIGNVPDRGGRANEMRPKLSDIMPGWSNRKTGSAKHHDRGRPKNHNHHQSRKGRGRSKDHKQKNDGARGQSGDRSKSRDRKNKKRHHQQNSKNHKNGGSGKDNAKNGGGNNSFFKSENGRGKKGSGNRRFVAD
eukprot:g6568.t1